MSNSSYFIIRVREKLDESWEEWFDGMSITLDDHGTELAGVLDQAALHGIIARVNRLGLQLVAVNEAEPPATAVHQAPHHQTT